MVKYREVLPELKKMGSQIACVRNYVRCHSGITRIVEEGRKGQIWSTISAVLSVNQSAAISQWRLAAKDLQHFLSLILEHPDRLLFVHLLLWSSHLYCCYPLIRFPSVFPFSMVFIRVLWLLMWLKYLISVVFSLVHAVTIKWSIGHLW